MIPSCRHFPGLHTRGKSFCFFGKTTLFFGLDNDGDGLIDGEDDNEFGDPRQFATKVAIEKIAEDVLNEIMTTW